MHGWINDGRIIQNRQIITQNQIDWTEWFIDKSMERKKANSSNSELYTTHVDSMFYSNDYYVSTGEINSPCSHTPSDSADWGSSSGWHSWIPRAWWDHTESRASCHWPPPCLKTQCADKTIWTICEHLIVTGIAWSNRQNNSTREHDNKSPRLKTEPFC